MKRLFASRNFALDRFVQIANLLGFTLGGAFAEDDEARVFSHGMLTEAAIEKMHVEIRKLRQRFAELRKRNG